MSEILIPKKHIETAADLCEEDAAVIGKIYLVAKQIAEEKGMAEDGYRIVNNCKANGGQEVYHIHFHPRLFLRLACLRLCHRHLSAAAFVLRRDYRGNFENAHHCAAGNSRIFHYFSHKAGTHSSCSRGGNDDLRCISVF